MKLRHSISELIKVFVRHLYKCNDNFITEGKFVDQRREIISSRWKNLIILDACRYDIFAHFTRLYDFFSNMKNISYDIRAAVSAASATPEFVREIILKHKDVFKDVIYLSANPMVDNSLKALGIMPEQIFYKYIPIWKFAWNEHYNTVLPKDVMLSTLKVFIREPKRKLVIHFLQPHFPYLSEKYEHINKLVYNDIKITFLQGFLNDSRKEDSIHVFLKLFKIFLLCGEVSSILSPSFCKYVKKNSKEVIKAYIVNLLVVLPYLQKVIEILPGETIITADHGEALGDYIHPLIPVRLWGHISRIKISSLKIVPFVKTVNNAPINHSLRKALKTYVNMKML